jgi:FlaA1/EpsC-like NDP-sugar epimerase
MGTIKNIILTLPRLVKRAIAVLFDSILSFLTVWIALGLRLEEWGLPRGNQWAPFFVSILLALPLFISFGLYRAIFRYVGSEAISSIAKVFIAYTVLFFGIFSLIGVEEVPRSIGITQPILLFIAVGCTRYIVKSWLGSKGRQSSIANERYRNVVIYGAGSAGRELVAALHVNRNMNFKGFVDDDPSLQGSTINGLTVFSSNDLASLFGRLKITDVLLALPSISQDRRNEIIADLSTCGVRIRTVPSLYDIATGKVKINDLFDLDMNDLLGRKAVPPNIELLEKNIRNKCIMVTGAGGSIGSELCRQIIRLSPKSLILIEISEISLYLIYEELKNLASVLEKKEAKNFLSITSPALIILMPYLASVRDANLMSKIIFKHKPDSIFHAAAYKHVPLVEQNIIEGIKNNVLGTLVCARASIDAGVSHFTLVSTDKAVRPTNIMGASKRIAELVMQSFAQLSCQNERQTCFSIVRFGNVLGSSGSVAPLFSEQIKKGGPVTLTHSEVTRYFMTIPEASQLVLQAGAMATGGEVFVLDMGEPVRIYDLAVRMIHLSGFMLKNDDSPQGDIEIQITGLRPGEKLYEELLIGNDPQPTKHPKIMKAHEEFLPWSQLECELKNLDLAMQNDDHQLIREVLMRLVPGYHPEMN